MKYISTRGGIEPIGFLDAIMMGLADDGGLILPETMPDLTDDLEDMANYSYQDLAFFVMQHFTGNDMCLSDLQDIINRSYTVESFQTEDITPVRQLDKSIYMLDITQGPTLAFKDIGLQFLGNLFEYTLEQRDTFLNIVAATSGDTGSAAIHGVKGKGRMNIFVMSPQEGMSDVQIMQMYCVHDPNVFNIAVDGVFDDCQDMMKAVNADTDFKKKYNLGAVNSTNWARVLAQTVYYFKAYFDIVKQRPGMEVGDPIYFSVPTGNFGDVYACDCARQMGLPIQNTVVATNENNVLDIFYKTGVYRPWKTEDVIPANSPSMNISKASNFERYLYNRFGNDPEKLKAEMEKLASEGQIEYDVDGPVFDSIRETGFMSGTSTKLDRDHAIRWAYCTADELIETHTADGLYVGRELVMRGPLKRYIPMCFLATAGAPKFADVIKRVTGKTPEIPDHIKALEGLERRAYKMDKDQPEQLKQYIAENAITR